MGRKHAAFDTSDDDVEHPDRRAEDIGGDVVADPLELALGGGEPVLRPHRGVRVARGHTAGQSVDGQLQPRATRDRVALGQLEVGAAQRAGLVVDDVDRAIGGNVDSIDSTADLERASVGEDERHGR